MGRITSTLWIANRNSRQSAQYEYHRCLLVRLSNQFQSSVLPSQSICQAVLAWFILIAGSSLVQVELASLYAGNVGRPPNRGSPYVVVIVILSKFQAEKTVEPLTLMGQVGLITLMGWLTASDPVFCRDISRPPIVIGAQDCSDESCWCARSILRYIHRG